MYGAARLFRHSAASRIRRWLYISTRMNFWRVCRLGGTLPPLSSPLLLVYRLDTSYRADRRFFLPARGTRAVPRWRWTGFFPPHTTHRCPWLRLAFTDPARTFAAVFTTPTFWGATHATRVRLAAWFGSRFPPDIWPSGILPASTDLSPASMPPPPPHLSTLLLYRFCKSVPTRIARLPPHRTTAFVWRGCYKFHSLIE